MKEQKVEKYSDLTYAKTNIQINIRQGWYVHTCVSMDGVFGGVLVVYQKEKL